VMRLTDKPRGGSEVMHIPRLGLAVRTQSPEPNRDPKHKEQSRQCIYNTKYAPYFAASLTFELKYNYDTTTTFPECFFSLFRPHSLRAHAITTYHTSTASVQTLVEAEAHQYTLARASLVAGIPAAVPPCPETPRASAAFQTPVEAAHRAGVQIQAASSRASAVDNLAVGIRPTEAAWEVDLGAAAQADSVETLGAVPAVVVAAALVPSAPAAGEHVEDIHQAVHAPSRLVVVVLPAGVGGNLLVQWAKRA
jgi:hypothetical protein